MRPTSEAEEYRDHTRVRWYGQFQRSIALPVKIDQDSIRADYEAGILTLPLPKSQEVRPKRIQVQNRNGPEGH